MILTFVLQRDSFPDAFFGMTSNAAATSFKISSNSAFKSDFFGLMTTSTEKS